MSAYTPSKKQLPSWMMMNDNTGKHWLTSNDTDMELEFSRVVDGIDDEDRNLIDCGNRWNWVRSVNTTYSACHEASKLYPEEKFRHKACDAEALTVVKFNRYPFERQGPNYRMCRFVSQQTQEVYPEYDHCFKSGGMDNLDCQKVCYTYPGQPGCEAIKAIVDKMTPAQRQQKIKDIVDAEKAKPTPVPVPEETVVIAASMKSVTPTAVQFSYVDPKTKKSVVVKKTLVDMYKPTDKVTVVLGKKTNKFVGLQKK